MNGGEHIFIHPVGFPISILTQYKSVDEWLKSCPYYSEEIGEEWAKKAWDIVQAKVGSSAPKMSAEKIKK